jgi:polyisoprenoid-binding protein YceI
MKKTLIAMALLITTGSVFAQKKTTSSATISFDATTPKDALPKAENKAVIGALDLKTGVVQFEAAVKNFSFSNPMMQDHFNGNKWMNSDVNPKFTFTGKITDLKKVNFTKNGTYIATVSGDLTLKGIIKPLSAPVTFVVNNGKISANTSFTVKLSDYNITGVPVDAGKIALEPKVTVSASF